MFLAFDPVEFWSYVVTAFMGGLVFKLFDILVRKARQAKEIERAYKLELARVEARCEAEKAGSLVANSFQSIEAVQRRAVGVWLAEKTREIDEEMLGKFWIKVGRFLGRIL